MPILEIHCTTCGSPYPDKGAPHCCPACGGLYDIEGVPRFDASLIEESLPGVWRYRHTFGFPEDVPVLTLGEGGTPLIRADAFGRRVALKCEFANPTGSFKDRGMALLCAFLKSRGVTQALEDSSGNAGAAFAAYAARVGIQARVFVPGYASGPKRRQIEMLGAEVVAVPGPRSAATEAVLEEAARGGVYASHAYMPFNLIGYATAAYEIWTQLEGAIGSVIVPAGQAGLLIGLARGFRALVQAGCLQEMPVLIGVQAQACAPFLPEVIESDPTQAEQPTVAEGVHVRDPLRKAEALESIRRSGGRFVAAREADILPGRDELARRGFYVEPTSALVWPALQAMLPELNDPVVAVLTGSGYKVNG